MCDTNGGMLPVGIHEIVSDVRARGKVPVVVGGSPPDVHVSTASESTAPIASRARQRV